MKGTAMVDKQGSDGEGTPRALVAFGGDAVLPWLRCLRPGYRHCFVLIEGEGGWILYNPLLHKTELQFHAGLTSRAIAKHYRAAGYEIVATQVQGAPCRQAPVRPFSCVEAVKRALGIHAGGVLTPWQLRQYLIKYLNRVNNP